MVWQQGIHRLDNINTFIKQRVPLMSDYLKQKMLTHLKEAREVLSEPTDEVRETALNDGISSMKSKIGSMPIVVENNKVENKVEAYHHYEGSELADTVLDVYRSNVNPKAEEVEEAVESPQPITKAKMDHMKAVARSFTGMRNGGNSGKLTRSTPSGNGDVGTTSVTNENGGNVGVGSGNYHSLTTSMTLEQYEDYIKEQWGLVTYEEVIEEEVEELIEESSVVKELEDGLLKLEDTSWQSIDKLMRGIAKEYDITPKELHKEFKSQHEGMIPDEWVKEQVQTEECGWYPLDEAIIHKTGRPYEVSLIWRGQSNRLKFFWPEMAMPSRSDMQRSVELFYPGGRLLAYYPAEDNTNNPMVLVPPMTENYVVLDETDWTYMSEEDVETYNIICEEEGEPVEAPVRMEDGSYEVVVLEYDTNEHKRITFGNFVSEDMSGMSQKSGDKRSTDSGAGMTAKGVAKYNSRTGGNLKTAVTTPPSKLKAGSKAAGRRKSFCARSKSWNGERGKAARARWNC